jgi:serine phosphatase RsbU (regulator of sigma subunit)
MRLSSQISYEDVFDRIPDPSLLIDLNEETILDASFSAERVLGTGEANCLNEKSLWSLIHFKDDTIKRNFVKNLSITKRKFYPRRFETILSTLERTDWDVEVLGHTVEISDDRQVLQISFIDITLRKESERLKELSKRNAKMVVKHMLPKSLPSIPNYEFAVFYLPWDNIGGDFYDFISMDDKWGICLGDAKGHGLEAALVMGMARKTLSMHASQLKDPKDILCKTNDTIFPDLDKGNFITCFFGLFDPENHFMDIASGGHNLTLVYRSSDKSIESIESKGLPLGLRSGAKFENFMEKKQLSFGVQDMFIQYSDGIADVENKKGELFGMERFEALLQANGHLSCHDLCHLVQERLKSFQKKHRPKDDICLLLIKRCS